MAPGGGEASADHCGRSAVHVRCPGCCLSSPVSVRIALKMVPASASPVLLLDQAPEAARRGDCCPLLRSPLDTCSQGEQDKKIPLRQPRIAHTQQPPNKLAAHWCWLSIDTEHCSLHPHPCWYVQLSMAFGTSKPSGPAGDKKRKATHTFCCMRLAGSPASWHDLCVGQVKHRTRSTAQRTAQCGPQVGGLCDVVLVLLQVLPQARQKSVLQRIATGIGIQTEQVEAATCLPQ